MLTELSWMNCPFKICLTPRSSFIVLQVKITTRLYLSFIMSIQNTFVSLFLYVSNTKCSYTSEQQLLIIISVLSCCSWSHLIIVTLSEPQSIQPYPWCFSVVYRLSSFLYHPSNYTDLRYFLLCQTFPRYLTSSQGAGSHLYKQTDNRLMQSVVWQIFVHIL